MAIITHKSTQELLKDYRITYNGCLFYILDKKTTPEQMVVGPLGRYREAVEVMDGHKLIKPLLYAVYFSQRKY